MRFIKSLLIVLVLATSAKAETIVEMYGDLHIEGNFIKDKNNRPVQLTGMSYFWSQWAGKYWNEECVRFLVEDWGCTIVRAPMGVEKGGYLTNPELEIKRMETMIDAAIKNGVYILVDYHAHYAHREPEMAAKFFKHIAKKYGNTPNVIYEVFNEPLKDHDWTDTIKPYAEEMIKEIRKIDPDNIIVVGTPVWSQLVNKAADNPILNQKNIAYTIHFYASTHKEDLRNIARYALGKGLCLMLTEFGTCEASGDGVLDYKEAELWFALADEYKISWCNWSVCNKFESASALNPSAKGTGGWSEDDISEPGKWIRAKIREKRLEHYGNPAKENAQ